jgi:hypothetical protein
MIPFDLTIRITCLVICFGVVMAIFKMYPPKTFWKKYRMLKLEEDLSTLQFEKDILEIEMNDLKKRVKYIEEKLCINNEEV